MTQEIVLPLRTAWDQSDVATGIYFSAFDKKLPAVLLTPACDLDHSKTSFWTFAALFPDIDVAREIAAREAPGQGITKGSDGKYLLSGKKRRALAGKLRDLLLNRYPRFQWLPIQVGGHPAHVADFAQVASVAVEEVKRTAERVASIASSWREQIPARYSAYMGRVGTDDLPESDISSHLDRLISAMAVDIPD